MIVEIVNMVCSLIFLVFLCVVVLVLFISCVSMVGHYIVKSREVYAGRIRDLTRREIASEIGNTAYWFSEDIVVQEVVEALAVHLEQDYCFSAQRFRGHWEKIKNEKKPKDSS